MQKINNAILTSILDKNNFPYNLKNDYMALDAMEGAVELAKILLFSAIPDNLLIHKPGDKSSFDKWYAGQSKKYQRTISEWMASCRAADDWYIFTHFNNNNHTREIFELLLSQRPLPPYLPLLCLNMMKQIFQLSNDTMSEITKDTKKLNAWYDTLFADKNRIIDWLANKKNPVRFYAGETNTVLGLHDRHFSNLPLGKDYEAYFDIGGGFNTSEINRLTGCSFTSLDIHTPLFTDYDDQLIIRKREMDKKTYCLNNEEMDRYLERQRKVTWQEFNVGVHTIPQPHASYCLVSTGFMTSTVRMPPEMEQEWCSEKIHLKLKHLVTSLVSMYRVIEVVKTGKRVKLVSISRASNCIYFNKVVALEWEKGKITDCTTVPIKMTKDDVLKKFSKAAEG